MSDIRMHVIKPLPKPEKRPSRFSALLLWAIAAGGLVFSALLSRVFGSVIQGWHPLPALLVTNLLYYLPFVVLPVFLLAKRTPGLYEAYRPNPISLFNTISVVFLALVGVFFVNDITVLWAIPLQKLGLNPLTTGLPVAQNAHELVLSVIIVAVIPAVCEEFMFRGAIMPAFEGEGSKRAMWITSVLFMMVHGSLVGMPTQIILGMVLALLVFWTDSIYAGLIYHTVHNASAVVLDYIQSQMAATGGEAAAESADLLTAIGGLGGVVSLLANIAISAALFLITMRLFRARGILQGVTPEEGKVQKLCRKEWIALVVGAAMCAVLYVSDFIVMLGG